MMRVSNTFLHERMLYDIQSVMSRLVRAQNELSSGKRILKPSDDPLGTALVLRWRGQISKMDRWQKNIEELQSRFEMSESNLDTVKDLLTRARDIFIRGGSDSLGPDEKKALADELDQILQELVNRMNAKYGDRYLFAGADVLHKPFEVQKDATGKIIAVTYHGYPIPSRDPSTGNLNDEAWLPVEVGEGVTMPQNVPGDWAVMKETSNTTPSDDLKMFRVIIQARDALLQDKNLSVEQYTDANGNQEAFLDTIDKVLARVGEALAYIGTKVERLQGLHTFYEKMRVNYEGLRSKLEDADVAEVYITYSKEQLVYQSALKVASNILTPSLIDYIR
ncbi:flagellar hook-associated protein 3 [bacterium 3DAC]|nr:flagellar hook-associated protein 3 [bacterium 3DAC]